MVFIARISIDTSSDSCWKLLTSRGELRAMKFLHRCKVVQGCVVRRRTSLIRSWRSDSPPRYGLSEISNVNTVSSRQLGTCSMNNASSALSMSLFHQLLCCGCSSAATTPNVLSAMPKYPVYRKNGSFPVPGATAPNVCRSQLKIRGGPGGDQR